MTEPEQESRDEQSAETLTDVELRGALESILLVVDSPATVEQLVSATGCDRPRIEALLTRISADFTARGSGIDLRFVGTAGGSTPGRSTRRTSSGSSSTAPGPSSRARRWKRSPSSPIVNRLPAHGSVRCAG